MCEFSCPFLTEDFGNPLRDIEDWMLPPYPTCLPQWVREGRLHPPQEDTDGAT